jgi:hypothetical protein
MRRFPRLSLSSAVVLLTLSGCGKNPVTPGYQKELTVFGYLRGNERLTSDHAIWIACTKPITDYYQASEAALRNGDVTITDQDDGAVIRLHEDPERPGYYSNDSLLALPEKTYQLRIVADGKIVTAATTVPPMLEMTSTLRADTINVVKQENLSRERPLFLRSENPEQVVLVDMNCNEEYANAEYIHPFHGSQEHPRNREEYDGGANREPKHISAFGRYRDFASAEYPGQIVIFWYSSMIVFYGSYTLQVAAIDDNYHRFLYREHPELEGGIRGGIGVFGSMCGKAFRLQVVK